MAGVAGCACLLASMAACGQESASATSAAAPNQSQSSASSTNSPKIPDQSKDSSPSAQNDTSPASSSSSSESPSSISNGGASKNNLPTPVGEGTKANTEEPSNQVLYLLSYIRLKGGLENVNGSNTIATGDEIGENVWKKSLVQTIPSLWGRKVENGRVYWSWGAPGGRADGSFAVDQLVSQYYSDSSEHEQINGVLASAKRNGVLAVLAMLKRYDSYGSTPSQIMKIWINGGISGNIFAFNGANSTTRVFVEGGTVKCFNCTDFQCYMPTYNSDSLINEYYSTPEDQSAVNQWLANNNQSIRIVNIQ